MVRTPHQSQKARRTRTVKLKLSKSIETNDNLKQTTIDSFFKLKRHLISNKVEKTMDSDTESDSTVPGISLSQQTVISNSSNGTIEFTSHTLIEGIPEIENLLDLSEEEFERRDRLFAECSNPFKNPDNPTPVSRKLFTSTSTISCSPLCSSTPLKSPQENVSVNNGDLTAGADSETDIGSDDTVGYEVSLSSSKTQDVSDKNKTVKIISDIPVLSAKKNQSDNNGNSLKTPKPRRPKGKIAITSRSQISCVAPKTSKTSSNSKRSSSSDFEDSDENSKPKRQKVLRKSPASNSVKTPTKKLDPSTVTSPSKNQLASSQNEQKKSSVSPCSSSSKEQFVSTPSKHQMSSPFALSSSPTKSPSDISPKKKQMNMRPVNLICEMVEQVLRKRIYSSLFDKSETQTLQKFLDMDDYCKYFLFKLFMYQPKWYNVYEFCRNINLPMEDPEIKIMYEFLKRDGFITFDYQNEDITTLISLLPRVQLKELCDSFRLKLQRHTREMMIEALLKKCTPKPTFTFCMKSPAQVLRERVNLKLGYCMKLDNGFRRLLHNVYVLNTFTNSDFVKPNDYFLAILYKSAVFPKYRVDEDFRLFYTRNEFVRFARAYKLRVDLLDTIEKKRDKYHEDALEIGREAFKSIKEWVTSGADVNSNIEAKYPHLQFYTAAGQYISILTKASDFLAGKYSEEVKTWLRYLLTLNQYRHRFGIWYCQLAKIVEIQHSEHDQAADILIKALESKRNLSEIELEDIAIRARRLKNAVRHKISNFYHDRIVELLPDPPDEEEFPATTIQARAIRSNTPGRKRHYLIYDRYGDKEFTSVEQIALNHYRSNGYPQGMHCEGSLIRAAFCFSFWDIIYETDIPGVFISKIQSFPLDFKSRYFYQNRHELIDQHLKNIYEWSDEEFYNYIKEKFQMHSHEESIYNLDSKEETLATIWCVISCIDREVLCAIFDRLVRNYRACSSGMPDLLMWNETEKKCKFVEVKGEHDKLSTKQKFWLKYLKDIGADVEVCHVESIGSKMKSPKKPKIHEINETESS